MIGTGPTPRILDFANRNVGIGCGNVHIWDPDAANGTVNSGVTLAGILPVYGDRGGGDEINGKIEAGLLGITVSPDFMQTGHIYLQYFPTFNPDNPVHPGLADGDQRRITKMGKRRISRFTVDLADQAARARLRGRDLRVRVADLQLLPPRRRHGLRLRGQPLRHHRRLQLVAEHERLLGQLPARALPDRRPPHGGVQRPLRQQQHLLQRRAPNRRQHQRLQRQDAALQPGRHDPRRVAADDRRQQHVHAADRARRRTARTSSAAPRATATRPSPRSTRWACATRRACSSTPRPTSRTRRGSAPTRARRRATQGPSTYENATQLAQAGNYGWPYCMGNQQAYRDRVADGSLRTANAAGFVTGGPAGSPTQGWYDCNNLVNDSTNNTGLTVLPHQTGTGMDAGTRAAAQPLVQPRQPRRQQRLPRLPARERRRTARPTTAPTPTQLAPISPPPARRSSTAPSTATTTTPRTTRRAGPSTGTAAGSCRTSATTAPSTACCSTPPPTRTAASRSTPTASGASSTGRPTTWTRSSGPTARSTCRSTTGFFTTGPGAGLYRFAYTGGPDTPNPDPQWTHDRHGQPDPVLARLLGRRRVRVELRRPDAGLDRAEPDPHLRPGRDLRRHAHRHLRRR